MVADSKTKEPKSKKTTQSTVVTRFAEAIKTKEGWYEGSRSFRNNNPGNVRESKFESGHEWVTIGGKEYRFAKFDDSKTGWMALKYDISCKFKGGEKYTGTGLGPQSTLIEFFNKYDSPATGKKYAEYVAKKMNVKATTTIEEMFRKNKEDVNNLYINQETGEVGHWVTLDDGRRILIK